MAKTKILALLAVMALLLALPGLVLAQAQPPRPPVFGGTAVGVDGSPSADGTMVAAIIDDVQVASTMVADGGYAFAIPQPPGGSFEGKIVHFMVGDLMALETGTWEADGGAELNLTASMMMAGPATVATAWTGTNIHLVDRRGMSLYLFTKDTHGKDGTAPATACTSAGCVGAWPPMTTDGAPVAMDQPEFARAGRPNGEFLGTMERTDDGVTSTQVTYHGWPLYYYGRDKAPGDVIGQYGDWFLMSPSGVLVVGGTNVDPAAGGAGSAGPEGPRGPGGVAGPGGGAGAAGPAGAKGAAGSAGSKGAAGSAGSAGSAGATGDAGAAGAAGSAGSAGPAGPVGPAGSSGGGGLAIVALIIAILGVVGAGGAFVMGRRS